MEVSLQSGRQVLCDVAEVTDAAAARRAVVHCAELIGMSESDRSNVAISVTEMATNVIKHASRGQIIVDSVLQNGACGLRMLAVDKGPGISNIARALEDGRSTAGTAGNGLGAIRRLATRFDIYSYPAKGTCVLAEFWSRDSAAKNESDIEVGVLTVPFPGESVSGDGWSSRTVPGGLLLMLADGLGHGFYAAEAARVVERLIKETPSTSPAVILQDAHDALKKTRGAAVAVAAINCENGSLCFAGVGNISATLLTRQSSRGMASHNGTAGHEIRRLQEFVFPWNPDNLLVMHSDGLSARWDLSDYPGIWNRSPSIIAAVLHRDFARERDDATVLVAKSV
jgi:anti-sigma regulatory factor (Ser/Thr protein kinase)